MRALVLGGTADGRLLAARLTDQLDDRLDVEVVSSLAGRLAEPRWPSGVVRVGGFDGVDGLVTYLGEQRIGAVVDATHPFAARITAHAVAACGRAGVPLLVLRRPGWVEQPGDDWRRVPDLRAAAAAAAGSPPGAVLLTVGRRGVAAFADDDAHAYVIRSVEPPSMDTRLPRQHTLVLARGPFTRERELALFREYVIRLVVTKDSGGDATAAKLSVARALGVPVVMIDRPVLPDGVAVVTSVDAAATWITGLAVRHARRGD